MNKKSSALKIIGTMLIVLIVVGVLSYLYIGMIIPLLEKFGLVEQDVDQYIGETSYQLILEEFASDLEYMQENGCYKVYDYYQLISLRIIEDLEDKVFIIQDQNNDNNQKSISDDSKTLKVYDLNDKTLTLKDRLPNIIEITRVNYRLEIDLLPHYWRFWGNTATTQKLMMVKTDRGLGVVFYEFYDNVPEKLFYEGKEIQNCKSIKDQSNNEDNAPSIV